MQENYSQVLERNLALFEKVNNGLLLDCGGIDVLNGLPPSFTGFTTLHSVYQSDRNDRMEIGVVPPSEEPYDCVILLMPKSKQELAFRIAWLRAHLQPGARVFLLGAKKEGVASGAKQLETLGSEPVKVDMARHCQLWQTSLDVPGEPFVLSDWETITPVTTPFGKLKLCGLPGVFSTGSVDPGTQVLLKALAEYMTVLLERRKPVQGNLLDFACGAGIIAACLKQRFPELEVNGVDNSELAIHCAKRTFELNGLRGAFWRSDGLSDVSGRFKWVVTNPPFHTGVKTDYSVTERFISQIPHHMKRNGILMLVANSFLNYPELIRSELANCVTQHSDGKYAVYLSEKTP